MERVKQWFTSHDYAFLIDRIRVFTESSATVERAARCWGCSPAHIAKSLSFRVRVPLSNEGKKRREKAAAAAGADRVDSPASLSEPGANGYPILIVAAGDAKVNSKKYKAKFACTPRMLKRDEVEEVIGYPAGGVCPFGLNPSVKTYLDVSLKRFEKVYPACGTANTGIPLSCEELEQFADQFVEWVDVCDGWQEGGEGSPEAGKKTENEVAREGEG